MTLLKLLQFVSYELLTSNIIVERALQFQLKLVIFLHMHNLLLLSLLLAFPLLAQINLAIMIIRRSALLGFLR